MVVSRSPSLRSWGKNCSTTGGDGETSGLPESVIKTLHVGDLVISLNYDIIFDIAIERSGKKFGYLPMDGHEQTVLLAKPHGSIHMLVNEREGSFAFAQPTSWGGGTHAGEANLSASILPPRLNKSYRDVPIARLMLRLRLATSQARSLFGGLVLPTATSI